MNLYPAIDIHEGKVVRLSRGDFAEQTVYHDSPDGQALEWESCGASWIHVVDLEGAKTGILKNITSLEKIRRAVKCRVQFGGGMRSLENIERVLDLGIDRVVVGTKALDRDFFSDLLKRFGGKIALGLDARDGTVRTEGWVKESGLKVSDFLHSLSELPLETVVYTNIKKDGMLEGPDIEGLREVMSWTKSRVILSGGISGMNDIEASLTLHEINFEGVIIGKALYEKRLDLRAAISAVSSAGDQA